ncbi:hypothetical protein SAMD00019534_071990, partial [Acytostelium subglobosum LB1]
IYLKKSKTHLFENKIEVLGYQVHDGKIITQPSKVEAIKTFPIPTTGKAMQSFLGLVNFYSSFIPKLAELTSELYEVAKVKGNIKLTEQQTYLVNTIKDSISDKSQLVIPNRNKCLELYTDASSIALGSTVNQRDDNGSLQLVAAFSRKLNESERMFTTTIRETMAIIETLKKYESMLIDSELLIKTDHLNITYLKDKQQLSPKEFRWLEYLNRF